MYSADAVPAGLPYCLLCFSVEKLSRCARCGNAYYCSKEHQVQHWKVHRNECKPVHRANVACENRISSTTDIPQNEAVDLSSSRDQPVADQPGYSGWANNNVTSENSEELPANVYSPTKSAYESSEDVAGSGNGYKTPESPLDLYTRDAGDESDDKLYQYPLEDNANMFSSLSSEVLSSTNNFWDVISDCDAENFSLNYDLEVAKTDLEQKSSPLRDLNLLPDASEAEESDSPEPNDDNVSQTVPLEDLCRNIISDLNEFSICVIDSFLGSKLGDLIAAEVKSMFMKGIFKKGEVVSSGMWQSNENIRGDVITWVDGNEPECCHIGTLIRKLDVLMTACNKMPNNGILSRYKLNRRTKAMIACYPGDGTHYKKHVDNPHGDGRCITCIYYLNKDWITKVHGGLLRIFPTKHESQVANIEPIFDRMLFFWSDRRNPHEVLPSFAVRFAITVWYFDSDERDRALMKYRSRET